MRDRRALVVGAGPAGLMAAERLAQAGCNVTVTEAMPSPGRKFLMAGKSGLNLTKDEGKTQFIATYADAAEWLHPMLKAFGPRQVQDWAQDLGQEVFTGTSGRVFPVAMKASPLLRAWLARLESKGVELRTRWRLTGLEDTVCVFDTPEGLRRAEADVVVLALGGASWARLGSDGAWATWIDDCAPFAPANVGLEVAWSDHMTPFLGAPVKGIALHAGDMVSRGEFALSATGLEGGGVYTVSRAVREGAALTLDLFPDLTVAEVAARLAKPRGKASLANHLRKALRLDGVRRALVQEWLRPLPEGGALAAALKAVPVPVTGLRPMDEAISTAGGVRQAQVDAGLMLLDRPGVFVAGEMLDWEAPTGGYLLTGCFATGRWAGDHAADYVMDY